MMCNVDDVKRTVAKRIKMARIERDLKQSELAELLETNQQNIARIEKGEMGEALETLARVAQVLHKPIQYFFEAFDDVEIEVKKAPAKRRKAA